METNLTGLADELGDLDSELSPLKPKIARLEALKKLFRQACEDQPADEPFTVDGERYIVALGARGFENHVNVPRLFKRIGTRAAVKLVNITLAALRAAKLAADVEADCVENAQTGYRPLTVVPRG